MTLTDHILSRHDAGESVATIATAENVSPGYVYGILRHHRPNRSRKARTRTSEKRVMVLGLAAKGIKPARVAYLAQCSEQYVYRILSEATPPS